MSSSYLTYSLLCIHNDSFRRGRIGTVTNFLSTHCNENPIYVFLFWELRGPSPNFHIHVFVSDLYNSQDRFTYFLQKNSQLDCGNI